MAGILQILTPQPQAAVGEPNAAQYNACSPKTLRVVSKSSPSIAKLTRPRATGLFARPRLLKIFDRKATPLLWVEGPPGAGKTSAIVAWLHARRAPNLWYHVDASDDDAATLFHYLTAAALRLRSKRSAALPRFEQEYAGHVERFARRFFRALYAGLPGNTAVVFDNYQEGEPHQQLHELVRVAVEELPRNLKIVVISRSAPPPELARLRAEQRLGLVGWNELRFKSEEASRLIRARLKVDPDTANHMRELAAGWVGGLVLMLEHVARHGRLETDVTASGMQEVFDYLATEVLSRAGTKVTRLLMRMAYLPRLSAQEARQMTGAREAGQLLEAWARRNLFIDARQGAHVTYVFHALFRTFLQTRSEANFAGRVQTALAKKAAAILERAGEYDEALSIYLAQRAFRSAAQLICDQAPSWFASGRRSALRLRIEALPENARTKNAWLLYWHAIARLGEPPAKVREQLEAAFRAFARKAQWRGQLLAAATAADSFFSDRVSWEGVDVWITRLDALLRRRGAYGDAIGARAYTSLTRALLYRAPADARLPALAKLLERFVDEQPAPDLRLASASVLLAYYFWRGDLGRYEDVAKRSAELVDDQSIATSTRVYHLFWLAVHAIGSGDEALTRKVAQRGRELTDDTGLAPLSVEFERFVAGVLLVRGDAAQARAILEKAVAPTLLKSRPVAQAWYHNTVAACDVAERKLAQAQAAMSESLSLARTAANTLAELLSLPLAALVEIELTNYEAADKILVDLEARAKNPWSTVQASALRCYAKLRRDLAPNERELRKLTLDIDRHGWLPLYGWIPHLTNTLLAAAGSKPATREVAARIVTRFALKCEHQAFDTWPRALRVTTLGGFEAMSLRGPSPTKRAKRVLTLFKLLVAVGPEGESAHKIIDALWPHAEGDAGHKTLEVSLYRLRKVFGAQDIATHRNGFVRIEGSACWIDAWAFEASVQALLSASETGDNWIARAERAFESYTGPFLPESDAPAQIIAARHRIHQHWLALSRSLLSRFESEGAWQRVIRLAHRAIEIDSENEELYRRLMHAHVQRGERAAAALAYQHCRERLAAKLGSRPSIATESLYRSIQMD